MSERKPFSPTLEAEMIRAMRPGEDQNQAKREFHEKRLEQKTSIATLASLMIELVVANPKINPQELYQLLADHEKEMRLTGEQKRMFRELISEFNRRQTDVRAFEEKGLTPEEIFEWHFFRKPLKTPKVFFGGISVHFILSDADFDHVSHQRKRADGNVLRSGGFFWRARPDVTASRSYSEKINLAVLRHEETHALKHMVDSVIGINRFSLEFHKKADVLKKELAKTKNPESALHLARQILGLYISANSESIKDEIFAYLREDVRAQNEIVSILTRAEDHLGLYDYTLRDRESFRNFLGTSVTPDNRHLIEKEVLEKFQQTYKVLVKEASDAAIRLAREFKYTPEQIFFFLNDVPLTLWKKEVARLEQVRNKAFV